MVGDFLISPAVQIEPEDFPHDLRLRRDDLKLLLFVEKIAIRCGAQPRAVCLTAADDGLYLLTGVRHRHFVDEKLKLNFQPVIVVWEVNVVSDGDDTHAGVPQILQFHQPAGIAAGETGKVFDNKNVVLVAHQPSPHFLITLPLLEGIAGAVTILVEGQRAVGEAVLHEIFDDSLFDRHIVAIQFLVHRNACVARDGKAFDHSLSPFRYAAICRSNSEMYSASCFLRNSS